MPGLLGKLDHLEGKLLDAGRPFRPMPADDAVSTVPRRVILDGGDLVLCIRGEMVDGDDDRHAEFPHIGDVAAEIGCAALQSLDILATEILFFTPPFIFSARTVATMTAASGFSPALRHLMSKNFSAPRSAPKPASVTT